MFKIPIVYIVAIIVLGLAVALRLSWQGEQTLPKNQYLKFVATLKVQPKIDGGRQVLAIGDLRVFVDLYPRYRVGDRLLIAGEADSFGRLFNASVKQIGREEGIGSYFGELREEISQNIARLLPSREATLVSGTVLGVDDIERAFGDQLTRTGTIHVVVVSGQNLMIVAGVFLSLIKYLGRRQSLVLALSFSILYAILTGLEPPVVRATLMVLASTLAIFWGREYWPLWNLIVVALLIIFIWPKALFEVSFQLTFTATLGIMTLGQRLQLSVLGSSPRFAGEADQLSDRSWSVSQSVGLETKGQRDKVVKDTETDELKTDRPKSENRQQRTDDRSRDIRKLIKDLFFQNAAIAISAYLFTAPIILFYFGRISPIAPLANVLVAEAVFPVMVLGFLVSFASLIFAPLAQLLAYLAFVPAFYFVKVVEIFAKIPVGQVSLGKGNLVLVISFYILLFALMLVWGRRSSSQ